MEKRRAGTGEPRGLPDRRSRGKLAGFARPGFQQDPGNRSALRRILADGRGRQEAVLVIGRPLLMLVPMDQDLGQFAGAVAFVAVPMVMVLKVRYRQDEPRPHRSSEEQRGGGESLPYTHAGIVA